MRLFFDEDQVLRIGEILGGLDVFQAAAACGNLFSGENVPQCECRCMPVFLKDESCIPAEYQAAAIILPEQVSDSICFEIQAVHIAGRKPAEN